MHFSLLIVNAPMTLQTSVIPFARLKMFVTILKVMLRILVYKLMSRKQVLHSGFDLEVTPLISFNGNTIEYVMMPIFWHVR